MTRIGVVLPQYHFDSYNSLTDFGKRVDDLGYDSLWIGESWGREAFSVLGYLAAVTDQVELGPAIVNVFSRTPTLMGMSTATMDGLCDGRFNLGLGPSNPNIIERWHDESFDRPLKHTEETIAVVEKILSGDVVEYDGDLFSLSEFSLRASILRETVPVYIAALGEQNRRLTGRFADGWIPHNIPFNHLEEAFEAVAAGASAADRSADEIEIAPFVPTVVAEDLQYARDRLADHLAYYLGTSELYNAVPAQYGFESEAKKVRSEWVDGDREAASKSVTDDMIDTMGLAASPKNAWESALEMADEYGIEHMLLKFPDQLNKRYLYTGIEALAPEK